MAVNAAVGAVSVRRIRGPSVAKCAPEDRASAASDGANPPSGPIKMESVLQRKLWKQLSQILSAAFIEEQNRSVCARFVQRTGKRGESRDNRKLSAFTLFGGLCGDFFPAEPFLFSGFRIRTEIQRSVKTGTIREAPVSTAFCTI